MLPEILEIAMLVCFGLSWPLNVMKSWKVRTTKGKSPLFLIFILVGYVCGIISKFVNPAFIFAEKWYVLFFYFLNFTMVGIDGLLYIRNMFLDRERAKLEKNA